MRTDGRMILLKEVQKLIKKNINESLYKAISNFIGNESRIKLTKNEIAKGYKENNICGYYMLSFMMIKLR